MEDEPTRPLRCILHLDLDCFYAQVESKRLGLPDDLLYGPSNYGPREYPRGEDPSRPGEWLSPAQAQARARQREAKERTGDRYRSGHRDH